MDSTLLLLLSETPPLSRLPELLVNTSTDFAVPCCLFPDSFRTEAEPSVCSEADRSVDYSLEAERSSRARQKKYYKRNSLTADLCALSTAERERETMRIVALFLSALSGNYFRDSLKRRLRKGRRGSRRYQQYLNSLELNDLSRWSEEVEDVDIWTCFEDIFEGSISFLFPAGVS